MATLSAPSLFQYRMRTHVPRHRSCALAHCVLLYDCVPLQCADSKQGQLSLEQRWNRMPDVVSSATFFHPRQLLLAGRSPGLTISLHQHSYMVTTAAPSHSGEHDSEPQTHARNTRYPYNTVWSNNHRTVPQTCQVVAAVMDYHVRRDYNTTAFLYSFARYYNRRMARITRRNLVRRAYHAATFV